MDPEEANEEFPSERAWHQVEIQVSQRCIKLFSSRNYLSKGVVEKFSTVLLEQIFGLANGLFFWRPFPSLVFQSWNVPEPAMSNLMQPLVHKRLASSRPLCMALQAMLVPWWLVKQQAQASETLMQRKDHT